MKKILIALAIMPLLIVACSSDDDIPSSGDFAYSLDHLYGEWRVTDVEAIGTIDLTQPQNELYVTPTYLKFEKDGSLTGEGVLGEGTGKYSTKSKTIYTSLGKKKINLEVTSLNATTAKVILDAKYIPHPLIKPDMGMVTLTLEKNYPRAIDFDFKIKDLYGKWHAVTLEGEGITGSPVDLTHPLVTPTYLTFEEKGILISEGYFGQGTGRYSTEKKTIYTLINKRIDFEVTTLTKDGTARISFKPKDIDFGNLIPSNVETATLVLKKQQ